MSPSNGPILNSALGRWPDVWVEVAKREVYFTPISDAAVEYFKANVRYRKPDLRGSRVALPTLFAGDFADKLIAQGFYLHGPK